MRILKISIIASLIINICLQSANAQNLKSGVAPPMPDHRTPEFSVSLSANAGKSNTTGITNEYSFNPNLGLELNWKKFGISMAAGTFNTNTTMNYKEHLQVFSKFDAFKVNFEKTNWTTKYVLVGPQYHFWLTEKIALVAGIKFGITDNKAPTIYIDDISANPIQNLVAYLPPYLTSRFAYNPELVAKYSINNKLALRANMNYLVQTGGDRYTKAYPNLQNVNFNLSAAQVKTQILEAPLKESLANGPLQYLSFGIGINYKITTAKK